jgi:membrane protein DedA with SNARE-associated domain
VKTVGGLIAVCDGALTVMVIGIVAISASSQNAGTIAGSTVAVIGSIVGAYLGVKVGTDQTAKALNQLDEQQKVHEETSKRAEAYALHVDKHDATRLSPER